MNNSNWETCELTDVADIISGRNQKEVESPDGKFPIYGSGGTFGRATEYLCEAGTTVIGRKGTINTPLLIQERFWNVDTAFGISPNDAIKSKLLYYFCLSFNFTTLDKSTTIPSLAKRDLLKIPLPLPPLNEQKRIVAKIEELFSELDAGVASLKQARTQLGTYRQSLLKQAFEGKLTAQWRRDHPEQLESPEQLLTRIQQERETRYQQSLQTWQTAVEEWEAGGKEAKKPAKPQKLKAMIGLPQVTKEKKLPRGWGFFPFGDLFTVSSGSGLTANKMKDGSHPVYGGNGICGYHSDYTHQEPRLTIGRVGAKCGVTHITKPESWITDNALVVSFQTNSLSMQFFSLLFEALNLNKLSVSTAQPVVSGAKLNPLPVPLCALPEQQEIVRLLEEQFTAIEQNEREIEASLQRAEALRQSILKRAFSGQLVPQDPTDEPAAQLLALIQQERTEHKAQAPKKPKKKATKKNTTHTKTN